MTSSSDAVTSESPKVGNMSIVFDVTATVTNSESPAAERVRPSAVPLISTVAVLLTLTVVNLCGNGFTLVTIRMTRRLWTKTNCILASHLLSHFAAGFTLIWYNCYLLRIRLFDNPCRWNVVTTGLSVLIRITTNASVLHTILVSVERYVAIVYPLHYETMFTDRTLKWAISAVWATAVFIASTYGLWLIDADLAKCTIIPVHYQQISVVLYVFVCIAVFTCYGKNPRRLLAPPSAHRAAAGKRQCRTRTAADDHRHDHHLGETEQQTSWRRQCCTRFE